MSAPPRSPERVEQARVALARADEIRKQGAEFRRRIKSLPREKALDEVVAVLVADPPLAHLGAVRIAHLIESVKAIGPQKSDRILRVAGVRADRKVRDLTERQRHTIVGLLEYRHHADAGWLAITDMERTA